MDAAGSKDGTGGAIDSGIPPSGYRWTFGDGGTASAPSVSHTYATPGTYGGTLTLSDRAGNVQTQTFSVTATKPIPSSTATGAPGAGATPVAGNGATTAGKVKIGRLIRFGKYRAHRLGRVRVTSSAATTFVGALKQGKRTIQRIGVTGGPGRVTLGFIPPKAGRYVLSVTGAGVTQRVTITVRR